MLPSPSFYRDRARHGVRIRPPKHLFLLYHRQTENPRATEPEDDPQIPQITQIVKILCDNGTEPVVATVRTGMGEERSPHGRPVNPRRESRKPRVDTRRLALFPIHFSEDGVRGTEYGAPGEATGRRDGTGTGRGIGIGIGIVIVIEIEIGGGARYSCPSPIFQYSWSSTSPAGAS